MSVEKKKMENPYLLANPIYFNSVFFSSSICCCLSSNIETMDYYYVTLLIIIISALTWFIYALANRNCNYWKNRNVPYVSPIPFFGNLKSLLFLEKNIGEFLGDLYNSEKLPDHGFYGIYLTNNDPALIIRDPELIRNICVKDFQHFSNRNATSDEKNDPVGYNNLFTLTGTYKIKI